ncbi:hypothetical protein Fcan01_05772 [Folsomia candida]|uniref:Uncharacterized protein n=1 Tax=Folsomia candida TaxID=158441 RepID=A0A226ERE0_FOLCA|nr:hypothetical protein Fcan01_05772 [Folsomia candida]
MICKIHFTGVAVNRANSNPSNSPHPSSQLSLSKSDPLTGSTTSSSDFSSNSRFSTLLRKISLYNDSQVITQLTPQSGTSNLHKLLQKLKRLASAGGIPANTNPHNETTHVRTKVVSGKLLGMNKIASSIPVFITNNTRLKRQLEGIFHVRGKGKTSSAPTTTTTTSRPNSPYNLTTHKTSLTHSSSLLPPLPKRRRIRYNRPPQNGEGLTKRLGLPVGIGHGSDNTTNNNNGAIIESISTNSNPKKEIGQTKYRHKKKEDDKITSVSNFHSTKSNTRNEEAEVEDLDDVPLSPNEKGKRNFTVEIVEIARKTVIKENNKNSGKAFRPYFTTSTAAPTDKKSSVDDVQSNTNSNIGQGNNKRLFNPNLKIQIKPFRPRLGIFSKPNIQTDSAGLASQQPQQRKPLSIANLPSVKYKSILNNNNNYDLITSSTTAHPISSYPISSSNPVYENTHTNTPLIRASNKPEAVEVQVSYQDQIPYNERDIDENDFKAFLDGHDTFGAKGSFKHFVSRNVTGHIPNQDNTKKTAEKISSHRRSRSRGANNNDIEVEKVTVKQQPTHQNNPKATVYTATGIPVVATDEEDKSIYQYSGMARNEKDKPHHFPKLPKSTLDALYQQGHPAIAKAPPGPLYKGHPLAEPYGTAAAREENEDYNPFQANPLVDEPPLKYDPESDRFYGNPVPDKDKLAQSNRPEPSQVQIENDDRGPEYQEEDRQQRRPQQQEQQEQRPPLPDRQKDDNDNNDNDDNKLYYERVYEPPEDDYNERQIEKEADSFIKDFVSLDNNFQPLPRPSADEENFKGLIAPEAQEDIDYDERRFERDNNGNRDNDRDGDDGQSTTRRSNRDNGRGTSSDNPNNDDDGHDDDYSDDEGGYERPEDEFDQSYVDALKQFDDEIKKIQDNEKNGITTDANIPPPTSTSPQALVITSPGPSVSYQQQRNAPPPPDYQVTTPTHHHQDDAEDDTNNENEEQEEQQQHQRRPAPDGRKVDGEDEEEEVNQRNNNQNEETTPTSREEEEEKEGDDDGRAKDADESQHVKINKVVEVKADGLKEDRSGNLDEDISRIEEEFRRPPQRSFSTQHPNVRYK